MYYPNLSNDFWNCNPEMLICCGGNIIGYKMHVIYITCGKRYYLYFYVYFFLFDFCVHGICSFYVYMYTYNFCKCTACPLYFFEFYYLYYIIHVCVFSFFLMYNLTPSTLLYQLIFALLVENNIWLINSFKCFFYITFFFIFLWKLTLTGIFFVIVMV